MCKAELFGLGNYFVGDGFYLPAAVRGAEYKIIGEGTNLSYI